MLQDHKIIPAARVAALLADAKGDAVFVAADAQRAALVAEVAAGLMPAAVVAYVPSSDALPGDAAPASPANVGHRVAALRRIRAGQAAKPRPRIVLVTTASASAVRHATPDAFDAVPPAVAAGDALDADTLAQTAADIGYITDDRVDEPGEIAVRGQVIDIFPADHDMPVRIELADGAVAAIRRYDPVTQRTTEALDRIELGRAVEPEVADGVSILAHLPGAAMALDPEVEERRERFLRIAAERGKRGRRQ